MNEEQADNLIEVLKEINITLKELKKYKDDFKSSIKLNSYICEKQIIKARKELLETINIMVDKK